MEQQKLPDIDDDYKDAVQAADDYPAPAPKQHDYLEPEYYKGKSKTWRILLYLLIIVLMVAIAGGVYWFKFRGNTATPETKSATQASSTQSQAAANQIASATKHYDSPNFYLGIDYPTDWTVTDNGGGKMTIVSPSLQLKNVAAQNVSGQIVLTITPKGQNLGAFAAGNAIAVLESEKIAYAKPTQNQRANTYLSFLQYAKTTAAGALDGIYITSDLGYQKGQDVPKTDIAKADPSISVSFVGANGQPLSIASTSWSDTSFSGPIKKMLISLTIN